LLATVPVNRYGFCGTIPTRLHRYSGSRSRTSTPSTSTCPPVASKRRGTSPSNVVLPAPVLPMIAVVVPGAAVNVTSCSTGASAPGYVNPAPRSSSAPVGSLGVTGSAGGATDDSVSSTSMIRSAHTAARGAMIATNMPIITEMRMSVK